VEDHALGRLGAQPGFHQVTAHRAGVVPTRGTGGTERADGYDQPRAPEPLIGTHHAEKPTPEAP
jgi:hypothetical protein